MDRAECILRCLSRRVCVKIRRPHVADGMIRSFAGTHVRTHHVYYQMSRLKSRGKTSITGMRTLINTFIAIVNFDLNCNTQL